MNNAWEYEKNNYTRISIKLNNKNDADVIGFLNQQDNKQGYIKSLIKQDIKFQNILDSVDNGVHL